MQTFEKAAGRVIPEPLAIVQAVVNTRYGRTRPDEWKSLEQLQAWLVQHQLLAGEIPVLQGDLRRITAVREAVRGLLRGNGGMSVAPEHIETLNYAARHAPCIIHFDQDGQAALVPDIEGVDGVIGSLLGIVFTAMADGTWARLKVCHNERCQKAFYDSSKNRSGTWCAMATCGSRIKARAYRKRQQERSESQEVSLEGES